MTLIKSISGIRGTIGGMIGEALTPIDTVRFVAAYGTWIKEMHPEISKPKLVVGRDARISGSMIAQLTIATLVGMGIDVVNLDLSTTPTVEFAVSHQKALGGIIITASHNPKNWNALKLLNEHGEFISQQQGTRIVELAQTEYFYFAPVDALGTIVEDNSSMQKHIEAILNLALVTQKEIQQANFSVVVDGINSSGGKYVEALLNALGVKNVQIINEQAHGNFSHNPEPLPEHLTELATKVVELKADLGIAVDPDVDRLAFICEDGTPFGEEYTLVAVSDYILQHTPGPTVSNLSSTQALRNITEQKQQIYTASAVGEVNVVQTMKATKAVIGGEGNGGVIYPELHYGRDALVGIALFLSFLAQKKITASKLRASYPQYIISKEKIELFENVNIDDVFCQIAENYPKEQINTIDGLKITLKNEWIHLRKSNTEPIIRIYAESTTEEQARTLTQQMIRKIEQIVAI